MGKIKKIVVVSDKENAIFIQETRFVSELSYNDHDSSFQVKRCSDDDYEEIIDVNFQGELSERSFVLNDDYDWEIVRDDRNRLILVPLKK